MHKKGLAPPISNLVGKLDFSEQDLSAKQADIDQSGIAMPSFGDVGNAVAEHMESEDEKRERIWSEKIDLVLALQSRVRSKLALADYQRKRKALENNKTVFISLQAQARKFLLRKKLLLNRQYYEEKKESITKIQSFLRMKNANNAYRALLTEENPSPQVLSHFVNLIDKDNVDFDDELGRC